MKRKEVFVSKQPDLLTTLPTDTTYRGLSQSELLEKVRLLHEQIFKTNQYLMEVHRISIYNWDVGDTGNIIVEINDDKKGFLLDSVLRLRGYWDPSTNDLELLPVDKQRAGWVYKVSATDNVSLFDIGWKHGDYALYDEEGILRNFTAEMITGLFTPIIPLESDTIQFENVEQDSSGIILKAHVKVDPSSTNDIKKSARGLYSDAYTKAKQFITIQEVAPTSDNLEGGLRIVYLLELPDVMYDGWLYLIPPPEIIIEE